MNLHNSCSYINPPNVRITFLAKIYVHNNIVIIIILQKQYVTILVVVQKQIIDESR